MKGIVALAIIATGLSPSPAAVAQRNPNAITSFIPTRAQVDRIERLLSAHPIRGGLPWSARVRLYTGSIERGRRYILGSAVTSYAVHRSTSSTDGRPDFDFWEPGVYIVGPREFRMPILIVIPFDCPKSRFAYDIEDREITFSCGT